MSKRPRRKYAGRGLPIGRDRQISVRSVRRANPDLNKYAMAIAGLAIAQAEAEAQKLADAKPSSDASAAPNDQPVDEASDEVERD